MRKLLIKTIALYQYCISPLLPPSCRYSPTCSMYASQALLKYGVAKGVVLSIKRILRCHPWSRGGFDPIP